MSFGTVNIAKKKEDESKPRQLDLSLRVAVIGPDGSGKTSFKDRFCFAHWVDPEAELLKAAKAAKKKPKKRRPGTIMPLPQPDVVFEAGTKEILWSPDTGCHWEEEVKEKDGDVYCEVLMVDSFQKYKTVNHRRGYLRGANVVAILFDVGSRESFDEARALVKLVYDCCPENGTRTYGAMGTGLSRMRGRVKTMQEGWGNADAGTMDNESFVCGIVVGCKCDKEPMTDEDIAQRAAEGKMPLHRVITSEEGERLARDHGMFYHESSPLIDADPNRNRTKNTVTQVWTINSTVNDAIEITIGRACCKWKGLPAVQYPQFFPKPPMPPKIEAKVDEDALGHGEEEGEAGEGQQERAEGQMAASAAVEGGYEAAVAVADGQQDWAEGAGEGMEGQQQQWGAEGGGEEQQQWGAEGGEGGGAAVGYEEGYGEKQETKKEEGEAAAEEEEEEEEDDY
jgi:hypothetical protein